MILLSTKNERRRKVPWIKVYFLFQQKSMEKQDSNVTVNQDSTMNQITLSNPSIGYHILKLLDGLRQSYNDAGKRINIVRKNQRLSETTKNERIKNLENWQEQLKSEFEFWAGLVKKWVSNFDEDDILYGDVIIEYYCNIDNIRKLNYITVDILCEE